MKNPSLDWEAPVIEDVYYHGDAFGGRMGTPKEGLSLTQDSIFAKRYASRAGFDGNKPTVRPFVLSEDAKILDVTEDGVDPHFKVTTKEGQIVPNTLFEQAKKDGYDAVKLQASSPIGPRGGSAEELYVINPNVVKELTKSQLTSIWNKVVGKK